MARLIAGIDEAGRGPVLGPLVISCVWAEEDAIIKLTELGVDDSKKLSAKRREALAELIREYSSAVNTIVITPEQINSFMDKGVNLNEIEALHMIDSLRWGPFAKQVYVDAADVKPDRLATRFRTVFPRSKFIVEHKADHHYTIVGAASIIAKTTRDKLIKDLQSKLGIDFGSGYPSDPKTRSFLKEYFLETGSFPNIARTHWKTLDKIRDSCTE